MKIPKIRRTKDCKKFRRKLKKRGIYNISAFKIFSYPTFICRVCGKTGPIEEFKNHINCGKE